MAGPTPDAPAHTGVYAGAQHPNYAMKVHGLDIKVPDKPMTEMEELCARIADTARRLESVADRVQGRIDGFTQQGVTTPDTVPAPEPQPGTLSALRHWQRQTEIQAERLSQAAGNLAAII